MLFSPGDTILFQGDSITDCGRSRNNDLDLGAGYAAGCAARVTAAFPDASLRFRNRGISGDRVTDLPNRWQTDCLALKPTWCSILIGINDCWRRYDRNNPTDVATYANSYKTILEQCRTAGIKLILCEPFLLPVPEDRRAWREDLDPKIHAVRQLAVDFDAIYVPFDGVFAAAATRRPAADWANDGVHPSPAGHALMADAWLRAVGCL
ncbi:MAG: SGNH/GDSL hydrolase family protein [Planctomycetota bacterium]|jgi:acyl-CoA thioesterase-1|nr:SGNH/GDSL hydrolase family protein [Planctomycetota bacterium]